MPTNIAALEINIVNNSPVDIYIKDIKLKIGKDLHRLVDSRNPFWEEVFFFYNNDKNEKVWDGSGIYYKKSVFQVPAYVSSYTILTGTCLFHDFPNIFSKRKKGQIILNTAVGRVEKKVTFRKYDENYNSAEMKDVAIYLKNIK